MPRLRTLHYQTRERADCGDVRRIEENCGCYAPTGWKGYKDSPTKPPSYLRRESRRDPVLRFKDGVEMCGGNKITVQITPTEVINKGLPITLKLCLTHKVATTNRRTRRVEFNPPPGIKIAPVTLTPGQGCINLTLVLELDIVGEQVIPYKINGLNATFILNVLEDIIEYNPVLNLNLIEVFQCFDDIVDLIFTPATPFIMNIDIIPPPELSIIPTSIDAGPGTTNIPLRIKTKPNDFGTYDITIKYKNVLGYFSRTTILPFTVKERVISFDTIISFDPSKVFECYNDPITLEFNPPIPFDMTLDIIPPPALTITPSSFNLVAGTAFETINLITNTDSGTHTVVFNYNSTDPCVRSDNTTQSASFEIQKRWDYTPTSFPQPIQTFPSSARSFTRGLFGEIIKATSDGSRLVIGAPGTDASGAFAAGSFEVHKEVPSSDRFIIESIVPNPKVAPCPCLTDAEFSGAMTKTGDGIVFALLQEGLRDIDPPNCNVYTGPWPPTHPWESIIIPRVLYYRSSAQFIYVMEKEPFTNLWTKINDILVPAPIGAARYSKLTCSENGEFLSRSYAIPLTFPPPPVGSLTVQIWRRNGGSWANLIGPPFQELNATATALDMQVYFSSDGQFLVSVTQLEVNIWELDPSILPNGQFIVKKSLNPTTNLPLPPNPLFGRSVCFNKDLQYIYVVDSDGIRIFKRDGALPDWGIIHYISVNAQNLFFRRPGNMIQCSQECNYVIVSAGNPTLVDLEIRIYKRESDNVWPLRTIIQPPIGTDPSGYYFSWDITYTYNEKYLLVGSRSRPTANPGTSRVDVYKSY